MITGQLDAAQGRFWHGHDGDSRASRPSGAQPGRPSEPVPPPAQGARFSMIAAAGPRLILAVPPLPRVGRIYQGFPRDLFDGQAISQGRWVVADVAGCAI